MALLLFAEACAILFGTSLPFFYASPMATMLFGAITAAFIATALYAYTFVLPAARVAGSRVFFRPGVRTLILVGYVMVLTTIAVRPGWYVTEVSEALQVRWGFALGPGFRLLLGLAVVLLLYAACAALVSFVREGEEGRRRQLRAFVVAFGFYDVLTAVVVTLVLTNRGNLESLEVERTWILAAQVGFSLFAYLLFGGILYARVLQLTWKTAANLGSTGVGLATAGLLAALGEIAKAEAFQWAGILGAAMLGFAMAVLKNPLRRAVTRVARVVWG